MIRKHTVTRWVAGIALLFSMCMSSTVFAQSLYERLGEMPAIECWIDEALGVIADDHRISDFFAGDLNTGQPNNLRDSLVEFACAATGGPCTYVGRDMACAHAGLSIDHPSFTHFINDLKLAARACRRGNTGWMPEPAYSELNKVLLSLRPPVVQDDPGENPLDSGGCP
jgi:hemoglobin